MASTGLEHELREDGEVFVFVGFVEFEEKKMRRWGGDLVMDLELLKKTNSWFSTFKNLVLVAGVASLRTQIEMFHGREQSTLEHNDACVRKLSDISRLENAG
ncbi:hypothetical protein NC652_035042 [Populus alba x Populus x berolinensis]|nr:hypothetical protein NC652_035042 [Populus alba x Populus x berolinensis]